MPGWNQLKDCREVIFGFTLHWFGPALLWWCDKSHNFRTRAHITDPVTPKALRAGGVGEWVPGFDYEGLPE